MTARITRLSWPPARRRWGGRWFCSRPTPAATRCSPTGRADRRDRDERVRAAGVAGLEELREASREMGVRLIVCEAGLRAEGLDSAHLLPGVEVAGVATFLHPSARDRSSRSDYTPAGLAAAACLSFSARTARIIHVGTGLAGNPQTALPAAPIDHQPIHAEPRNSCDEILEIDRFPDIAAGAVQNSPT